MKSNRFRCGIGDRRGLAEWHRIFSDLICCWWWFAKKLSSNNLGGHGQKFYFFWKIWREKKRQNPIGKKVLQFILEFIWEQQLKLRLLIVLFFTVTDEQFSKDKYYILIDFFFKWMRIWGAILPARLVPSPIYEILCTALKNNKWAKCQNYTTDFGCFSTTPQM